MEFLKSPDLTVDMSEFHKEEKPPSLDFFYI
jgi:hypothetical protein